MDLTENRFSIVMPQSKNQFSYNEIDEVHMDMRQSVVLKVRKVAQEKIQLKDFEMKT